jgi:CHAD domain-containing protein
MHYDLRRLKALFDSTHASLLLEAFETRRVVLADRLREARRKPSEKKIHNLRLAGRRTLATLELLETALPRSSTRSLRDTIRRQLRRLGRVRDVQVQLGYCDQLLGEFPQLTGFRRDLKRKERNLRRQAGERLRSPARRQAGERLRSPARRQAGERLRSPARRQAGERLRSLAPRKIDRKARRVLDELISTLRPDTDRVLGARIDGSIENAYRRVLVLRARVDPRKARSIHKMRVAFKKFRYMAEIAAPCFPKLSPERLEAMHAYQDRMGTIQDLDTLLRTMAEFRRQSGRTSMLVVENEIRRRRQRRIDDFMQTVDELRFFWSAPRADSREVV